MKLIRSILAALTLAAVGNTASAAPASVRQSSAKSSAVASVTPAVADDGAQPAQSYYQWQQDVIFVAGDMFSLSGNVSQFKNSVSNNNGGTFSAYVGQVQYLSATDANTNSMFPVPVSNSGKIYYAVIPVTYYWFFSY